MSWSIHCEYGARHMTGPSTDISFRVYDRIGNIPLDEESWDRLSESTDAGGVFLQHFWVRAWWHHFGRSYKLFFVTAESGGEVLAFAPLMIDKNRTLRFIGDPNADYLGFVIPPQRGDLLAGFLAFLSESRQLWNVVHLRNIPRETVKDSGLVDICRQEGLMPWNNYSVAAPYLQIDGNDEVVSALLGKYSFRRSERLLKEQGSVRFEVFNTDERAACFWEVFAQQHIDRCRRDDRSSTFSKPDYLPFLKALFESDAGKSRVQFSGLFLDESPVAFHFGFVSQQRLLWYKPSFDIRIKKGSPGVILIRNLIQHAQQCGLNELDFTIGDEPFKNRFCSERRTVDEFRIHKHRAKYVVESGYWRLRQSVKRLIKPSE